MIRTLIEVSAETEWDHERQLSSALEKLGFFRRDISEENFQADIREALKDRGLTTFQLVEEVRTKRGDPVY